jgi:excisionase family DNA binding protein
MDTDTLTISEAAVLLGRSKQYVFNWLVDGRLPHATAPHRGRGRWSLRAADVVAHKATLREARGRKLSVQERLNRKMHSILEGANA